MSASRVGPAVDDPVSAALVELMWRLPVGSRLPGERELAETLSVSRTALRDRLSLLEGLGVLQRRVGSGTYVRGLDPDSLTVALGLAIGASHMSLEALHSVRTALERQASREAARSADPVAIAHMRAAVLAMERSDDGEELESADLAFHQCLLRAAGNPALTFFADALEGVLRADLVDRRRRLGAQGNERKIMVALHLAVYEAVQSRDETAAMRAIDSHFDTFDELLGIRADAP
jgi:GntR family transcriptional repressor for pyruvate dehydrogenase complex